MKSVFILMALLITNLPIAQADQKATMTCTGSDIILSQKSPYLGENSEATQDLFVLKAIDNDNESTNTAYFLNVEFDIGGKDSCFGAGSLIFTGENEVKGAFQLCIQVWQNESDGTVIYETSSGVITYNHGLLKGKEELVFCILE